MRFLCLRGISFTVDVSIPKSAFEGEARSRGSTILETMPGPWSVRCERGARATFRNAGIRESNGELPSEWPSITRALRRDIPLRSSDAQRSYRIETGRCADVFLTIFETWVILGIWYYRKCRGNVELLGKKFRGRASDGIFATIFARTNKLREVRRSISHERSKDVINFGITSKLLA